MASIEELKALSILEVAESLGMSLQRTGSYTYAWEEHDSFTINVRENYFNWFARSNGGDVIKMVQVVQEELTGEKLSFKQAKHFLEEGSFDVVDVTSVPEKEPFSYYLEPYETKFIEAREYLKEVRGLSDETINFFSEKGVLAQATKKIGNYYEPIIVFKSLNSQNEVIGASLQGIRENNDLYERGRLKQIMRASDGLTGMHIDIGQPKRLVFAEAPIDLMSYYELHKGELSDVRLIAMDGLKESTISRHVAELLYELGEIKAQVKPENYSTFLSQTAEVTDFFKDGKHQELITLAVDNDTAGHTFINRLADKGISFSSDLPSMPADKDKMDWNDALKESKEKALDRSQEPINNIGGELINRNSGYLEGEPSRTAPQPEEPKAQPDFPANIQLYFNIERPKKSSVRLRKGYHYASNKDIRFLNRYADDIQKSASWYLQELANSKVTYFYQDKEDVQMLQVNFEKHHWMHLTGIAPVYSDWVDNLSEQFIEDVAAGKGNFANLSLGLGFRDKVKLMPLLPEIFETDSFVFDDLSSVEKMGRLDVANAIRSDDRDVMLAFRTDDSSSFPATLLKPNQTLNVELDALNQEKTILGVFIEKNNEIKTLSVNKEFVVDGGQQMLETLIQNQELGLFKEDLTMAEPFTDVQKEHIREFFKTRISDVKTDYIYLNSGQEETAYYLDGYLFAHQYAELVPLSQNQQVEALMSRLVSDDGREFDEIELGFTINRIDQDFLKDKFGYNPDASIEDYRQSEKNIDRIQAKEEEAFLQSIDRENFTKVLSLVKDSDAWTVFHLKTDEELGVSTNQVYDFIDRYLDPNHDLDYGFDSQFFSNLKTEDLLKIAEEKGLYLNQEKRANIAQLRENKGEAVLPTVKQEITEYKLEPHWASANEIKADSFEELKMKFLEQMDQHIELEKEFTASSVEFQKDRHSIAMGVWSDKQILKYMRDDSFDFEVNGFRIESSLDDNPYDLLDSISEDGKLFDEVIYNEIQKGMKEYQRVQAEKMHQAQVRKEELERDTDGDGIPDDVERNMGTNPYSPDTDGDGKSDQEEISYGSNPLAADNSKNENLSSSGQQKTVAELIAVKDSKGLAQVLKEGVKDYFKSDTYKQYLLAMSKFHNYSPLNIQMILRQNPRASHVASFKKWKDEFSRSVNKGEKALRIFAPITVKKRDPKTNEPLLDKDGKEITYTSFKLVPVFDVSQTDGKELPKPVYELKGSYQDYGNLYKSAKEVSEANGVPISFSENTKGAKGYYSPVSNEIVIKKGLSEQHTLKTIFHEMAHSDLHNFEKRAETPFNLSTAELQAESVAFVVSSHYGLDTSEYSFGYLASWTQDPKGLSDLEGQIKIVQKEADSLISRIDQALEKYQSKELTKDAFQQKLDRLKEQSKEQILESKEKETAKDELKKAQKSDNQLNL